MIKSLYIKDFALIENTNIDFASGLNVIIGETGSGKSMLIDALSIAFGHRANSTSIRNGATKSIIEIEIYSSSKQIQAILDENEIEYENNSIIIRREISLKSGTRNFINDTPVNVNILKQIGDLFIDFHGQHEHQSLLNNSNHLSILDKAAGLDHQIETYLDNFNNLKELIEEYDSLIKKEKILREKNEFTKFKFEEIQKVNPTIDEDELLENELKLLENAENLHNLSSELFNKLYDSDISVWNKISESTKILSKLKDIDYSFSEFYNELESSLITIKEISSFTNSYLSNIEFNPEKIEEIRNRLLSLRMLKKKYGNINDILVLKENLEKDIKIFNEFDILKSELEAKIENLKSEILEFAKIIETNRIDFSKQFSNKIIESLSGLGISNANFMVNIVRVLNSSYNLTDFVVRDNDSNLNLFNNGINQIEFYLSTNLGESLKPLKQVASGGEISRIMLSIKNILADKDNISTLIFDEIDTGVSGRIAQMVGISMKNLSKFHQVIAISHLPQISALSDVCILVAKFEESNKTFSTAKVLDDNEKVREIAKLISGNEVTESSIESANQLINLY